MVDKFYDIGLFEITNEIKETFENYQTDTPEGLENILIKLRKLGYSQLQTVRILMGGIILRNVSSS